MTQDKLSEDALGKLVARCDTLVNGTIMNDAEALRLCAVTIASVLPDAKTALLALRSATPMPGAVAIRLSSEESSLMHQSLRKSAKIAAPARDAVSDMSAEDAARINAMQLEVVESAFRAMLAAAPLAATPMPGVKVLEWGRYHIGKEWHGNVVHGTGYNYLVKDDGRWCSGPNRTWVLDQIGNVEAAKAAAQADYEARVLSALTTPPAREISEAEVERAARAIDALWSEGQDRGPAFEDTEREYQAHCRSTARAALEAARSPS
jgi:hypothetical protein